MCEEAGRSWLISVLSVSWLRIVMARQIARSDCPKHEKKIMKTTSPPTSICSSIPTPPFSSMYESWPFYMTANETFV
ncbi:hypothetical protein CHCC14600_3926 [Bacillus licheniformis]|nr:hypothetical protein CHCC14600_3926 [Bacillus licheniformis]